MDRVEMEKKLKEFASYEEWLLCELGVEFLKKDPKAATEKRTKLRAAVIKEMGLDPKIGEHPDVEQVFDNLAKAEVELSKHKGAQTCRLIHDSVEKRGILKTVASMVAMEMRPAPKRARKDRAPDPEAPAAAGASGDFVDLTQDD